MEVIHERVAGLDVHKKSVVACVRLQSSSKVRRESRTFETTTAGLEALLAWLSEMGCTHVAMEATGVYWKPVWNILSDWRLRVDPGQCLAHQERAWPQDRHEGRRVDRRSAGLRPDPGELRAGSGHPGPAVAAAHAQAVRPRADPARAADPEDLGRGQHQAGCGDQRHPRRERPADDRGDDRRREQPAEAGGLGRPAAQGQAGRTA